MGIRKATVTGLLVLTTTVAVGCGAGTPKGSGDALVDPIGAGDPSSPSDQGVVDGAAPSDGAVGDDGSTGGDDGTGGAVGGTTGGGEIGQGGGTGGTEPDGALPGGSPLPESEDEPTASELPGDPFGAAEATYRVGTATLTIGSTIHRLTRLAGPGTYFHEFGSDVVWTSGDGWYLQVGGAKPNDDEAKLPAYIAIDWVHDGQHWVTWDPSGCKITIDAA
ncbi:MAG TPA: hypothetical protein VH440_07525, partial [Candidatus Limnocylindrales bacterium]